MEIDVGATGTTTSNPQTWTSPAPSHQISCSENPEPSDPQTADRKRKKPNSSSTALKSILRQRSELSSCSVGQKNKRKRAVKFTLQDKPDEVRRWNGKRLRTLALDLDRWDNLPNTTLRTINKQKTRHTKRIKFCHSIEDLKAERSAGLVMDDGTFLKNASSEYRETENKAQTVPDVKLIEKSYFVDRWLRHSSKLPERDDKSAPYSSKHIVSNTSHTSMGTNGCHSTKPCSHPVLLRPPVSPEPTSSLLSLSLNFNTMCLQKATHHKQ